MFSLPALALGLAMAAAPAAKDTRLYEMRVYYAPPGKLDALHARFRDHTMKLFEKHSITNVGYFVPVGENKESKLVYFLSYPDRKARDASWKAFMADPDWVAAYKASEKDGTLVSKVVTAYFSPTDYSPELKIADGKMERVFEMRTYTATKGNLDNLNARFRDHTLKLFEKYGMTNVIYWNYAKGENKDKSKDDLMLVYLLSHKSQDAAKASFDSFRKDPDWIKARSESETKGGGSLTEAKDGVLSEFLKPTDYSPLK